jgi:S-(hydroxymethyl)glutathione synthase
VAKAAKKKPAKKAKAKSKPISLHPMIDKGKFAPAKKNFAGGTLTCNCATDPVTVELSAQSAYNHACGCSKCWKPDGAVFSVVAVVPSDKVKVTANGHKLKIVDENALILRHACTVCGAHMHGPVERPKHAFTGLTFVSSIIGQGFDPAKMGDVRARLKKVGLPPYDCLSPGLMDYIETHNAKLAGVIKG